MAITEISEAEWYGGEGTKGIAEAKAAGTKEPEAKGLLAAAEAGGAAEAIFFYTPLCGTCKAAERMLEVADAAGVPAKLYKMNIAFAPRLREDWRIASVPCLAVLRAGKPVRFEYAMHSVVHLYDVLHQSS